MKGHAPSRSLPQYNGPKLAPFAFQNPAEPRIEFLIVLGTGLHSEVHRARIDGKIYAAKLFCFWSIGELVPPNLITDEDADRHMNGKIIDFSQARTSPHEFLDLNRKRFKSLVAETCATDFQAFDDMMMLWMLEDPGQRVWDRFMPNWSYGRKLRHKDRYEKWFPESDCVKFDAALYDWKAAEKKRKQLAASKGATASQQKPTSGAVRKKTTRKARR
ncbi:hypothetical protein VHEMI02738 [[Torrubiella] hemipterigena]|uniref:Uncharacterized protein n=1 Tax=[Torrubiella] hemipterigena TaxID=1531966 RepID=A0A0A1TBG3_9HYPO|nr:hypothetical protein VHEMI02738 [[Torrubiella] hemipterigena]